MLSVSTVTEALDYLSSQTGRKWVESEFFDIAKRFTIELHGIVPRTARTLLLEMQDYSLVEKYDLGANHSTLAVLFPFNVGQLADRGDTEASHPHDHDRRDGMLKLLSEPVHVTRNDVRVRAESLRAILNKWREVQAGLVHPATCPPWMLPADVANVGATTATPAPANEGGRPAAANGWQAEARTIADEQYDRDTANKCRDSLEGYSRRVAKELTSRAIKGPHGKSLSIGTVKREALQGQHWWNSKAK